MKIVLGESVGVTAGVCADFDFGETVELADEVVVVLNAAVGRDAGVLGRDGEVVVAAATPVEAAAGTVVSAAGGMTLKLTLALHSARVVPSGQQPLSVQYCPSGQ